MGIRFWAPKVLAVAQQSTGSIDSVDATPANNTFTVTIGGIAISKVGDTDVATTAAALVVLLNASTHPYFAAVTWTNPSAGNIVGVGDVAGVLFIAVLTETGAGSGSVTDFADDTTATGPNQADEPDNWQGTVPGAGDTAIITGPINMSYGLEGLDGATMTLLQIPDDFTGRAGLDRRVFATSSDGETVDETVVEYRPIYLKIDATDVRIGERLGPDIADGSERIMLDMGTVATTIVVFRTSETPSEEGMPAVRLKCVNTANVIHVFEAAGGVGLAVDAPDEVSTVDDIFQSGGFVSTSDGVTFNGDFQQSGGESVINAAATLAVLNVEGPNSVCRTVGDYTITAAEVTKDALYNSDHEKSGGDAITAIILDNSGNLNGLGSNQPRTWATVTAKTNSSIEIDDDVVTITALVIAPVGRFLLQLS